MKFLVDAQLPVRLAKFLQASGYDTLHTRDLSRQNATSDTEINDISIEQKRIVIPILKSNKRLRSSASRLKCWV